MVLSRQAASQLDTADDGIVEPSSPPLRRRRGRRPVRRTLLDRVTASTVVGLVAALLVFVLAALVLRDRREMTTVAVATERIPAGATITRAMVRAVDMPTSVSFSSGLVRFDDLGVTSVAARTVQPGEPLSRSALGSPGSTNGARVMAIPVDSWQAVGGQLDVGDQVDVIDTAAAQARYVLSGAAVVGRASESLGGGIVVSSSGKLWLTVEVTAEQALDLASVIEAGKFVLVRSTGVATVAPPPSSGGTGNVPSISTTPTPSTAGGG